MISMKSKRRIFFAAANLALTLACAALFDPFQKSDGNAPPTVAAESLTQTISTPLTGLTYIIRKNDFSNPDIEIWQFNENGELIKAFEEKKILFGPVFSPDGGQMAYTGFGPDYCTFLANFDSGIVNLLTCGAHRIISWIPAQPNTALANQSHDPYVGSYTGALETISLLDGSIQPLDTTPTWDVAISPDGSLAAYQGLGYPPSSWLYSWESGNAAFNPREFGVNYPYAGSPNWSPDGGKISWGLVNEEGISAVGVFDLESKAGIALHPFEDGSYDMSISDPTVPSATWSPDGRWLALDVCAHGPSQSSLCGSETSGLWIMSADGQSEYQIAGRFSSWSPDSQWIAFVYTDGDLKELRISKPDGSETLRLAQVFDTYFEFNEAWSPDGKYLAFKNEGDEAAVVEAGIWQTISLGESEVNQNPIWHPTGSHLIFIDPNYAIWAAETGNWQPQQLAEIDKPENPDGNTYTSVSFFWHPIILPSFDTLTLPEETNSP